MSIFFFQNRVERLYLSWIGKPIPADIAGMCRYPPICADMCRYVPICADICRYLPVSAGYAGIWPISADTRRSTLLGGAS